MNRTILFAVVISVVIISTSFVYYEHNQSNSSTNVAPHQTLNQMVRNQTQTMLLYNFYSSHEYNNVNVNISSLTNSVMNRFYVLENNSSFKHYYTNYSYAFSVGAVFDFNTSQFNSSDPIGLNLDCFYFTFPGILNSSNSNNIKPCYLGSVSFSINVGTGVISGPQVSVQRIKYYGYL